MVRKNEVTNIGTQVHSCVPFLWLADVLFPKEIMEPYRSSFASHSFFREG